MTRAAEEELHGPIVGLSDLFEHASLYTRALVADIDRHERGRCGLAELRSLTAGSPVVVAIDDLQWLDPVSAGALRFAFHRLEHEPVLVLATERSDPSTSSASAWAELTPTQTRIRDLVVAGRGNREIAGELFVSVATVEAHLTRIYRKLHVRSRTELARVERSSGCPRQAERRFLGKPRYRPGRVLRTVGE